MDLRCPPYYSEDEYFKVKQTIYISNEFHKVLRKNIKISFFELNLLKLLAIQQVLSTHQLHRIYNAYHPDPIKKVTLLKKFSRWAEKGIVNVKISKSSVFGNNHNLYSIGDTGIKILVELSYLTEDWLDINTSILLKKKRTRHFIGQQDVAVELFSKLNKDELFFETIPPYQMFGDNKEFGVPDWILRFYDKEQAPYTFYVEFDVGTESITNKINNKYLTYIDRANTHPEENIILLLSAMDETFHYRGEKSPAGEERIANLKRFFIEKEVKLPSNLQVNVHLRSRVANVVKNYLLPMDKQGLVNILIQHFEKKWGYAVEENSSVGFYQRGVPEEHYADNILEIRNNNGQLIERIGVIVAEEGNIHSLQKINGFYQAMKSRSFISTIHRLVILHEDSLSISNDSYGIEFNREVLLGDCQAILQDKKLPFMMFTGVYQKKPIAYPFQNK